MLRPLLVSALLVLAAGCTSHTHATDFHGVPGLRGEATEYQRTTSYALHGLFKWGLIGSGNVKDVVSKFNAEAAGRGATRVHILDAHVSTYWWVFPPISFFIQPVVTTVQGNVEGADPEG